MSIERGILLNRTGRHELAEQEYRAALAAEPRNSQAHVLLAHCLSSQKKHSQAIEAAKEAISLRPESGNGYTALATVYMMCGQLKAAAATIERAIALNPVSASDRGVQAAIRVCENNWPAALRAADAGLAIDPHQTACVNARSLALAKLGRLRDAIDTNAISLNHDPEEGLIHANQGWALLHSGARGAAAEHFREALRLEPNLKWAQAGLARTQKPTIAAVQKSLHHLAKYLLKALGMLRSPR